MEHEKAKRLYQYALEYVRKNRPDELAWGNSITPDTLKQLTAKSFLDSTAGLFMLQVSE